MEQTTKNKPEKSNYYSNLNRFKKHIRDTGTTTTNIPNPYENLLDMYMNI